jgi:ATP-dependent Clp protease ATP-binding subunit ClpA
MARIAEIGVHEISARLEHGQNMSLDVSQNAMSCIAEKGYDIRYGARPLKRVLTHDFLNPLSRMVLEGGVVAGEVVRVRTRAEADMNGNVGFSSSDKTSTNKNDSVVIRTHDAPPAAPQDETMTHLSS